MLYYMKCLLLFCSVSVLRCILFMVCVVRMHIGQASLLPPQVHMNLSRMKPLSGTQGKHSEFWFSLSDNELHGRQRKRKQCRSSILLEYWTVCAKKYASSNENSIKLNLIQIHATAIDLIRSRIYMWFVAAPQRIPFILQISVFIRVAHSCFFCFSYFIFFYFSSGAKVSRTKFTQH